MKNLIKGIRNQGGSIVAQTANSVTVKWDATAEHAVGRFERRPDGRFTYYGSIRK